MILTIILIGIAVVVALIVYHFMENKEDEYYTGAVEMKRKDGIISRLVLKAGPLLESEKLEVMKEFPYEHELLTALKCNDDYRAYLKEQSKKVVLYDWNQLPDEFLVTTSLLKVPDEKFGFIDGANEFGMTVAMKDFSYVMPLGSEDEMENVVRRLYEEFGFSIVGYGGGGNGIMMRRLVKTTQ